MHDADCAIHQCQTQTGDLYDPIRSEIDSIRCQIVVLRMRLDQLVPDEWLEKNPISAAAKQGDIGPHDAYLFGEDDSILEDYRREYLAFLSRQKAGRSKQWSHRLPLWRGSMGVTLHLPRHTLVPFLLRPRAARRSKRRTLTCSCVWMKQCRRGEPPGLECTWYRGCQCLSCSPCSRALRTSLRFSPNTTSAIWFIAVIAFVTLNENIIFLSCGI